MRDRGGGTGLKEYASQLIERRKWLLARKNLQPGSNRGSKNLNLKIVIKFHCVSYFDIHLTKWLFEHSELPRNIEMLPTLKHLHINRVVDVN